MKFAFFDPVSRVLKAHGFVESNEPGDVVIQVAESFDSMPGDLILADDGKTMLDHRLPPQLPKSTADKIIEDPEQLEKLKQAMGLATE